MAFSPNFRATSQAGAGVGALDAGLRAYMLRVYNWMASGLVLTGLVAYLVADTALRGLFFRYVPTLSGDFVLRPTGLGWIATFAPLVFVMVMSFGVNRLSRTAVQTLFWVFCACMGASMASLVLSFTGVSVARVFLITAATFAAMSIWGYTTRTDLSRFGSFLIMGLIGLVIAGAVNMFLHSSGLYFVTSAIGVLIFTGLAAFDTQRIRASYQSMAAYGGTDLERNSVYDALTLYLNFINLFQFLIQFMGVRVGDRN